MSIEVNEAHAPPTPSYQLACLVWDDLCARKGIGNELESYPTATQRNIFYALVECADAVIGSDYRPADPPAFLFDENDEFTGWPTKAD